MAQPAAVGPSLQEYFSYKKGSVASRCKTETSGFGSLMSAKHKTQENLIFNIPKLMVIQEKNLSAKRDVTDLL